MIYTILMIVSIISIALLIAWYQINKHCTTDDEEYEQQWENKE